MQGMQGHEIPYESGWSNPHTLYPIPHTLYPRPKPYTMSPQDLFGKQSAHRRAAGEAPTDDRSSLCPAFSV